MICIHRQVLFMLEVPDSMIGRIALEGDGDGFATSPLFSFDGGGNQGRDGAVLESEIERLIEAAEDRPPVAAQLLLVGMSDRYDAARKMGAIVREICTAKGVPRMPTPEEAAEIRAALTALPPSRAWVAEAILPHLATVPT